MIPAVRSKLIENGADHVIEWVCGAMKALSDKIRSTGWRSFDRSATSGAFESLLNHRPSPLCMLYGDKPQAPHRAARMTTYSIGVGESVDDWIMTRS